MDTEEANPRLSAVVRLFNRILTFFFGHLEGERRVWMHWQNLREDPNGNPRGFPWEGRAWIHIRRPAGKRQPVIHWAWNLWTHHCGIEFELDNLENGIQFFVGVPPISLWFGIDGILSHKWMKKHFGYESREISLRVHDWSIWWNFFTDPDSWSHSTPRWRNGSLNLPDFFLGRTDYKQDPISKHEVMISLPEGNYPATIRLYEGVWKRPRWFARRLRMAEVSMNKPAPVPGKGENSWDCGDDAIYGLSCEARNVEDAISKYVQSVLNRRRRHGGSVMMKYPTPA